MNSRLKEFDLNNKTVFLRVDLNVPIIDGKIFSDYKIQAIRPTVDYILSKKGKIVLATHISRPEKDSQKDSTEIIYKYLKELGYNINFEKSLNKDLILKNFENTSIILLENLRFWPEEKVGDINFAEKLKSFADFYVNDAFGTLHRNDTSIMLLPQLYEKNKKTIGFLVEKELSELSKLKNDQAKPLILILGGGKVKDKLALIEALIEKTDTIILCPALVFTILKAENFEVGTSLVESSLIDYSKKLLKLAKEKKIKLIFPEDYLVEESGILKFKDLLEFTTLDFGISVGPKSLIKFNQEIINSKTIFFNCAMGFFSRPETLNPLEKLLEMIANSKCYSMVGGGDSVAAVQYFNLENKINFLSTGGGSTLEFLSGKILPGLKYL